MEKKGEAATRVGQYFDLTLGLPIPPVVLEYGMHFTPSRRVYASSYWGQQLNNRV